MKKRIQDIGNDNCVLKRVIALAKKKKQHFVPRFYLKRFADKDGLFDLYHIQQASCFNRINHKDQCQRSYFYGDDLEWENRLSRMEREWDSVFSKIDKRADLTDEDLNQIKLFALFQRQRTLGEFNYRHAERAKLYEMFGRELYAHNGWKFDDEAKKQIEEHVDQSISPSEMLELAQKLQKYIEDLDIRIIEYVTSKRFIISDVPVIAINPFHFPSIGYGCIGLVLLFPVSPTVLVAILDSKMYKTKNPDRYVTSNNEDEVITINNLQFVSAEEILLGNEKDFPVPDNNLINARSKSREGDVVTRLGSDDQQLWVTGMRNTIYSCDLSFAHVNHAFRRIPFICREGVPRIWEEAWEVKLKTKVKLLSDICSLSPEAFHGYTSKEIRDGCNRFYREMIKYWGDTRLI